MTYLSPIRQGEEADLLVPWGQEPGRLWSLLDMMRFYAERFFATTQLLVGLRAGLQAVEKQIALGQKVGPHFGHPSEQFQLDARDLMSQLDLMGLKLSAISSRKLLDSLEPEKPIYAPSMIQDLGTLLDRIKDEMSITVFLAISDIDKERYENEFPFGNEVGRKFPCLAYEVTEASKCLALSRSTASAFHSIRCLEAGIRAASRSLGIADPTKGAERSWMKALGAIKSELDKRWPPSSLNRMSGDGRFFEEFYGALSGMQNPYRNATMHLDHNYTEGEAEHIFLVVKGIIQKVAFRMDELGEPKA